MKLMENCQRCGKYAKLKDGLCRKCRKEMQEQTQEKKEE
jgi:predicted amidophosphoribosyltransferase